jgi:hypothetical protein
LVKVLPITSGAFVEQEAPIGITGTRPTFPGAAFHMIRAGTNAATTIVHPIV